MNSKNKIINNLPSMQKARQRRPRRIDFSCLSLEVPQYVEKNLSFKKYMIKTYGCQANVRDEESIRGILEKANMVKTDDVSQADLVIFNTCAIRANAEDKLFGEVGSLKALKAAKKDLIILVCGCMVQQETALEKLEKSYPQVDIFLGTNAIHKLLGVLDIHLETGKKVFDVTSDDLTIYEELPVSRTDNFKAFVNVMFGCDKFCTYCIVPFTRGKERSRRFEDIMNECRVLVESGYQEITLVGQNVNAYGLDLGTDGPRFGTLLSAVAELGIPRLRFITSHPWNFDDEMIDAIAKHDNIMKNIHLPLQSGNDEVLKKMGRRYTLKSYRELVAKLKSKISDLSLTTDIIVGFPNETKEQFQDTLKIVEEMSYSNLFTFIYSPRNGTPAAKMVDDVSQEEKHARYKKLQILVDTSIADFAKKQVGRVLPVLVEGQSKTDDTKLSGYTESGKVVHFDGDNELIGKIINLKITESRVFSLRGEIVDGRPN